MDAVQNWSLCSCRRGRAWTKPSSRIPATRRLFLNCPTSTRRSRLCSRITRTTARRRCRALCRPARCCPFLSSRACGKSRRLRLASRAVQHRRRGAHRTDRVVPPLLDGWRSGSRQTLPPCTRPHRARRMTQRMAGRTSHNSRHPDRHLARRPEQRLDRHPARRLRV